MAKPRAKRRVATRGPGRAITHRKSAPTGPDDAHNPSGPYHRPRLGGSRMPQSLVQIYVHVVFSTKNRTPWLKDKALRQDLHRYLHGACRNQGCPALSVGGVEDHVHLLVRLGKT